MTSLTLNFKLQVDSVKLNQIANSVNKDNLTLSWAISDGNKTLPMPKLTNVDLTKDIKIGNYISITVKMSKQLGSLNFRPRITTLTLSGDSLGPQCQFYVDLASYGDTILKDG